MPDWFNAYGFTEVDERLLVGALPGNASDVSTLASLGATTIVNLTQDEEYGLEARAGVATALTGAGITELRIPSPDYGNLTSEFLDHATQATLAALDEGALVYLHCRAGWQRSAAVATGVVAIRHGLGLETALQQVQARKPTADPLPHQLEDLERWYAARID